MDEVHRLKDPKAQITVAAKALNVKRRWEVNVDTVMLILLC